MKTLKVATTINPRFDHVTPIESTRSDVTITHRCHVIAELLAVARTGLVDVVLIADDLELVSLETLQQLADGDGYGPKVAAISEVPADRDRLQHLGIQVASPQLTGPQLVQWLQEVYAHPTEPVETIEEFSAVELQFLEHMDPDHEMTQVEVTESDDKLQPKGRSGRRAAPYDPLNDVPDGQRPEPLTDELSMQLDTVPLVPTANPEDVASAGIPLGREPDVSTVETTQSVQDSEPLDDTTPLGHVTAVWGPIGSPGVTTLAVNMAVESALIGHRTLLIDADTFGAAVAVHLGLLDDTAAIAQACRTAEHHGIDAMSLGKFVQHVTVQGSRLGVLTGLTRSERWPQVRAAAWEQVLQAARSGWDHVIIDCGFGLEEDEELSFDIPAPQRNATTVTAVSIADTVMAVGTGDPVGFVRFMKGYEQLTETTRQTIVPVINKVAAMTSGVSPKQQLGGVWERFGPSVDLQHFIPWSPESASAGLLAGKVLAESGPKTELRQSIRKLMLANVPPSARPISTGRAADRRSRRSRIHTAVAALKQRVTRDKRHIAS